MIPRVLTKAFRINGRTGGLTDGWADQQTVRPAHTDARRHLILLEPARGSYGQTLHADLYWNLLKSQITSEPEKPFRMKNQTSKHRRRFLQILQFLHQRVVAQNCPAQAFQREKCGRGDKNVTDFRNAVSTGRQLPKASAVDDDIDSTTRCFTWERHNEKY